VSEAASLVAAHPQVREVLLELQRRLVPPAGAVVEGRDIGSVVFPQAQVKVYLSAGDRARARRRARQLGAEREEGVLAHLRDRDRRDAARPVAPMRPAPGAVVIDTTRRSPEQVAERVLRLVRRAERPNLLYRVARRGLAAVLRTAFSLEVRGAERVPAHGPAILAANHRSLIDIPVVSALTARKVWFMGKEELFRAGVGARLLTALGGFPVRRGRPDRRALTRALELLGRGELVGVYPEGTRTPQARFEHVEDGLAYLALRSGAPVVPVAISGTEAVFPPGQRLPKLVRIRAAVGEPFTLGHETGHLTRARVREATERARRHLQAVMRELEP
jgi:1-acyl-sn-glycerol-3-phosphate acyltransferase